MSTASERMFADSPYPLGRDPEWEQRSYGTPPAALTQVEADYLARITVGTTRVAPHSDPWSQKEAS